MIRTGTSWQGCMRTLASCVVFSVPVFTVVAQAPCSALKELVVPTTAIGLPTRGAIIRSAESVPASAAEERPNGRYSDEVRPYCKLLGTIAPVDSTAPPIQFEVNLPADWNGRALQFGGGGYNGTLITGLSRAPDSPRGTLTPLAQGYATFGTDAGHQVDDRHEIFAFALNDEALVNFTYASYKKVRDVAVALITRRYGRVPAHVYYVGTSEGGREGLMVAQRFPADYDGVISRVPVISWVGLSHAQSRNGPAQADGGWLDSAHVALLNRGVLAACDSLDGLHDGIVSNYMACRTAFHPESLRCALGASRRDDCLTDRQVASVSTLHSPYTFSVPLANGVRSYPGYGYGGEDQPGGYGNWISGEQPASFPIPRDARQGTGWVFGGGMLRYFVMRDSSADPMTYTPAAYADRLRTLSDLMDATNPDLSAFAARGGKLIMKEHMADFAQSPFAGTEYYETVVARMGQATVDRFMRLYVTPGATHGGTGVSGTTNQPIPTNVDLLGALDAWVDAGRAPAKTLVQTTVATTSPSAVLESRPMCSYPQYPRYLGSGDPKQATSFECVGR